jgi:pimeloyl-ACP methyl ester carboxylesterase
MLMLHGAVVSSDYMVPLARRLAPALTCHAVDLPGYGRSEPLDRVLHVEDAAAWVTEWMDAVGLARVHLFGNSLGAQVAAALAQRFPARVESVVLLGPTVDPASRTRVGQLARLFADALLEHPGLHLTWARDFLRAGPRRAWATLAVALDDAIEARRPEITAPVLVIRGRRDPLASRAWSMQAARLAGATFFEVAHAAHGAHYDEPDDVARAILEWLRLEAPRAPATAASPARRPSRRPTGTRSPGPPG